MWLGIRSTPTFGINLHLLWLHFYDLRAETLEGDDFSFADLKGKRVLIVNTASRCGYTPQYKPLEELHKRYKDQGLVILGFPQSIWHARTRFLWGHP